MLRGKSKQEMAAAGAESDFHGSRPSGDDLFAVEPATQEDVFSVASCNDLARRTGVSLLRLPAVPSGWIASYAELKEKNPAVLGFMPGNRLHGVEINSQNRSGRRSRSLRGRHRAVEAGTDRWRRRLLD